MKQAGDKMGMQARRRQRARQDGPGPRRQSSHRHAPEGRQRSGRLAIWTKPRHDGRLKAVWEKAFTGDKPCGDKFPAIENAANTLIKHLQRVAAGRTAASAADQWMLGQRSPPDGQLADGVDTLEGRPFSANT